MSSERDDFRKSTIITMAQRVNYVCSNLSCRKHTAGPHANKEKSTLVGIAAHISAAAPGGPRFDANMTSNERKDINNGIWLCANCSIVIDKNPTKYSIQLLQNWKSTAEQFAKDSIESSNTVIPAPVLEILSAEIDNTKLKLEDKENKLEELKKEYNSLSESLEKYERNDLSIKAKKSLNEGRFEDSGIHLKNLLKLKNDEASKIYSDLSKVNLLQLNFTEAVSYGKLAIKFNPEVPEYSFNLATALFNNSDYILSIKYYQAVVKLLKPDDKKLTTVYSNIAANFLMLRIYDKAKEYCNKALELPLNAQSYIDVQINLFYSFNGLKEFDKAKVLIKHLEDFVTVNFTIDCFQMADVYHGFSTLYINRANKDIDPDKALDYSTKSLKLKEKFGGTSISISKSNHIIGMCFHRKKNYKEAVDHFEIALQYKLKIMHEDHLMLASTYQGLGATYLYLMGEEEQAIKNYDESIRIYRLYYDEDEASLKQVILNRQNIRK